MSIFKTRGYRDIECLLSIAAIFPPPKSLRLNDDRKGEDEPTFHITIVNKKDADDESTCYIELSKKQLRELNKLIETYLKTGITKEL